MLSPYRDRGMQEGEGGVWRQKQGEKERDTVHGAERERNIFADSEKDRKN